MIQRSFIFGFQKADLTYTSVQFRSILDSLGTENYISFHTGLHLTFLLAY